MPRTPIDYSITVIYKLVHKEDYYNANIYIGSTTDFTRRKNEHENSCNNDKHKDHNAKKYQYIRANGGWNGWNMVEIEKHSCSDGNEARAREEYWRSHYNAQLNMKRAYITEEQDKEMRKERKKEYREQNKEKLKEYNKKKVSCECGCNVRIDGLTEHRQSQKQLLQTKQNKYEFVDDCILEYGFYYPPSSKREIIKEYYRVLRYTTCYSLYNVVCDF
jgi:hypothetical protein